MYTLEKLWDPPLKINAFCMCAILMSNYCMCAILKAQHFCKPSQTLPSAHASLYYSQCF